MKTEEQKAAAREEQRRAVEAGKCRTCRKPNPDAGSKVNCPKCRKKAVRYIQAVREHRAESGTCTDCHRKPLKGLATCRRHRDMRREKYYRLRAEECSQPAG